MPRVPPWNRPRPAKKPRKLTPEQREAARESARLAGRRYPNLIDNMLVLRRLPARPEEAGQPGRRRPAPR